MNQAQTHTTQQSLARLQPFSWERYSLVGSILEQARHKKFLNFGGTFKVQIFFQWCRSCPAVECSILDRSFILSTSRYADFTVKTLLVFSVQFKVSCSKVLNKVFPFESCEQTSHRIFFLPHCIVLLSIRSLTYIIGLVSPKMIGLWDSHFWVGTSIVLPSPTLHREPSLMISLLPTNSTTQMEDYYQGLHP